jgi:hypothetical protein
MTTNKTKQATKTKKSLNKVEKTNKVQEFISYVKIHKVASLFITIILIGLAIYGSMVLYEKWQFKSAEKQLDALYTDIVGELGEPVSYEKNASCGYSSTKFSKGKLSCSISYLIDYAGTSSTQLSNSFYTVMSNSDKVDNITKPYRYRDVGPYTLSFKLNGNKIDCGATIDEENKKQYIVLSCYQNSIYKIYPTS